MDLRSIATITCTSSTFFYHAVCQFVHVLWKTKTYLHFCVCSVTAKLLRPQTVLVRRQFSIFVRVSNASVTTGYCKGHTTTSKQKANCYLAWDEVYFDNSSWFWSRVGASATVVFKIMKNCLIRLKPTMCLLYLLGQAGGFILGDFAFKVSNFWRQCFGSVYFWRAQLYIEPVSLKLLNVFAFLTVWIAYFRGIIIFYHDLVIWRVLYFIRQYEIK